MLSVSERYLQNIVADSRDMPYRVTLAGAVVLDRNTVTKMILNESVSGDSGVAIGTANSATLNLTLKNADKLDYTDVLVEPESGLTLPDGTIEYVPLGKFWVTDFSTSDDYKTLSLTCADGMYLLSGEYVSELEYPAPISAVVNEIATKTGVEFISSLPEIIIRKRPEGLTYRDAMGYLAGCCGKNARFNRLGQLEFVWYTDSGITIEQNTQYLNGFTKLNDKPLEVNFEVSGQKEMYSVSVVSDGNGGVTATPGQNVAEEETVVLSINPFAGYELAEISAITDTGRAVTLYMNSEGGRTFVQPDSNVTVTASFRTGADGPFKLTVRSNGNGGISFGKSSAGNEYFEAGEIVRINTNPNEGYEVDIFTTIPTGILLEKLSENNYQFEMPQSDVTVTVNYREAAAEHKIMAVVDESEVTDGGYVYVEDANTGEFPLRSAPEGTAVAVSVSPTEGHEFDRFESNVELQHWGGYTYGFTMPAHDVSITAYYKYSENEAKYGLYEWLDTPATPPTAKKYWAVFYKEDRNVSVHRKFHLVCFDSWTSTGYNVEDGKNIYKVQFSGYYHCRSLLTGDEQAWDTSVWEGNGASGSTLQWNVYVGGHAWNGSDTYGSGDYCLLASNIPLFRNGKMIFEKCENAIMSGWSGYVFDGEDVREKMSLTYWKCPDTLSTPLPASNWMIVKSEGHIFSTRNENYVYDFGTYDSMDGLAVVFFDSITIEKYGTIFSNTDEEFYIAHVKNAHYCRLVADTSSWGTVKEVSLENAASGTTDIFMFLRHPENGSNSAGDALGVYNVNGVLASSVDLYAGDGLFMYKNSGRVCDCASPVSTFSLRRRASVAEPVTINYTNPLIYEKMVDSISSLVQSVTYTPAKVKHRGNPAFQAGDVIQVPDKDGTYHNVLIMQQTMTFGGGMNSEIMSPGQTEKKSNFSSNGPITTQIKNEVKQSNVELERRVSANNSLVYAAIYKTISTSEAKIALLTEWQTHTGATKAELKTVSDTLGSSISLVVEGAGEEARVRADIVMEAINNDKSSIKISADKLELEGQTLDIKVKATNIEGVINAEQINADGITVDEGTIGGWNVTEKALQKGTTRFLTDDSITGKSLVNALETSPMRIALGRSLVETETRQVVVTVLSESGEVDTTIELDETPISVEIVSDEDDQGTSEQYEWEATISGNSINLSGRHKYGPYDGEIYVTINYTCYAPITKILEDGSLYTSAIKATGGVIGGWDLGMVQIQTSQNSSKTAYALSSEEMYDSQTNRTYRVYLTADGVYANGRNSDGSSYFANKTWLKILDS